MGYKTNLSENAFCLKLACAMKKMRKSSGYTQEQISNILNIVRSTYTYYELNKTSPSPYQVYKLLCLYNISFEAFISKEQINQNKADKDKLQLSSLRPYEKLLIAHLRLSDNPLKTAENITAKLKKQLC